MWWMGRIIMERSGTEREGGVWWGGEGEKVREERDGGGKKVSGGVGKGK